MPFSLLKRLLRERVGAKDDEKRKLLRGSACVCVLVSGIEEDADGGAAG